MREGEEDCKVQDGGSEGRRGREGVKEEVDGNRMMTVGKERRTTGGRVTLGLEHK